MKKLIYQGATKTYVQPATGCVMPGKPKDKRKLKDSFGGAF